jgi:MFS family permease
MLPAGEAESDASNHPSAKWMGVIAFLNVNITFGCIWGSFSVVLASVEARLGIGRELSTLAIPALNLASAIFAPLIGIAVGRISLRLILIAGSLLSISGFGLLALSDNYPAYLIAYGLLIGPGMAIAIILPGTLVTRWFTKSRGLALGLVNAPIILSMVPLLSSYMLRSHGLPATYGMLAVLAMITLIVNFFVIDRPPGSEPHIAPDAHGVHKTAGANGMSMGQLLMQLRFWALVAAYSTSAAASIILGAHTVPMVRSWGLSTNLAATLISIQLFSGVAGTLAFGWIGDKIGGALALGILVFVECVLWAGLLLHLPFVVLALIFGVFGALSNGAVPAYSLALSQSFGGESFSRAYGLTNLLILPISVLAVPAAAMIYIHTGSYTDAIALMTAFLAASAIFALATVRRPAKILVES